MDAMAIANSRACAWAGAGGWEAMFAGGDSSGVVLSGERPSASEHSREPFARARQTAGVPVSAALAIGVDDDDREAARAAGMDYLDGAVLVHGLLPAEGGGGASVTITWEPV